EISAAARALQGDAAILAQNAEELLSDASYVAAIDGIAKEDLLYEIIQEVHEVWAANLQRSEILQGDPLTRIWVFVNYNVIGNASNLVNSAVFFRDFGALTGRRREHILALRDVHDNTLRELIREGQADGSIRADVPAEIREQYATPPVA
ncbi:MAG TPA: hypothetical protein PLV68_17065, partial [Ilumatobacteraceae bacterium]|nr:hypothetical protein [Ilumatobacteraceae bacterium]